MFWGDLMETILYILLVFFAVIGICDIIHCIHIRIIKPVKPLKKVLICKLDTSDFETQLNYLLEQYKWHGTKYVDKFICLCDEEILKDADIDLNDEFLFIDEKNINLIYEKLGSEAQFGKQPIKN